MKHNQARDYNPRGISSSFVISCNLPTSAVVTLNRFSGEVALSLPILPEVVTSVAAYWRQIQKKLVIIADVSTDTKTAAAASLVAALCLRTVSI